MRMKKLKKFNEWNDKWNKDNTSGLIYQTIDNSESSENPII